MVLDPVTVPSHHGPDVQTVLPHISITTMAMIVPTTMMHMHAIRITTKKEVNREKVIELIRNHPRMGLVKKTAGIKSTAELKEFAMDLGRQRADLYENCIFEDSIYANKNELCFFQAIHQEGGRRCRECGRDPCDDRPCQRCGNSIKHTNTALGFTPIQNNH